MPKTKEQYLDETVKRIDNQKIMISIPDEIGGWWGLVAEDVMAMLKGKDITEVIVPISSFGGDVYEAFQIFNILKSYPATVTAYLYSKCMSAGTIIACAADKVYAVPQTVYMIHKALTYGYGNADEQRKTAQMLDITDDMIAQTLANKSGMSKADILDLMAVESYFTAEQAVALGFIDELVDTIPFDFQISDEFVKVEEKDNYDDWSYGWLWDKVKPNLQNVDKVRVFNSADLSKYKRKNTEGGKPSQIDNKKDNSKMTWIDKVLNKLNSLIPSDKQAEAKAILEAENSSMVAEIKNSAIAEIENSFKDRFAAKEDAPVLNVATLKKVLNEATDEEKAELLGELGYKEVEPVELEAIAENEEFKNLQKEVATIKNQLAGKLGNTKQQADNNGKPPVKVDEAAKELSNEGQAAKAVYDRFLNSGSITKEKYDELVSKLA